MNDYDAMNHEQLARAADELREARASGLIAEAEFTEEMAALNASARKRPQQITGYKRS
jgi:hypothetical protein